MRNVCATYIFTFTKIYTSYLSLIQLINKNKIYNIIENIALVELVVFNMVSVMFFSHSPL